MPEASVIRASAGADVKSDIVQAVGGLGGLGAFVKPGSRVLLKPNFNTADPFPASSAPDFVAAMADLCHEAGAAAVAVGDSCTYFKRTANVMRDWGIDQLRERRPWLEVIDFDRGRWQAVALPQGQVLKKVSVPAALSEFDTLILLPCLKTHVLASYTGALKLSVGLMKPSERLALHASGLQPKIADLNLAIRPDLIVMDARKCFIDRGPMNGTVREPGLVLASRSRVALDIEGVRIIRSFPGNSLASVEPEELPQIKSALALGIA